MKVSTTLITFRVDIDFDGCNVDTVYTELIGGGMTTPFSLFTGGKVPYYPPNNLTPKAGTVNKALIFILESNWNGNCGMPKLQKLKVEPTGFNDLMMGTCCINFECDIKDFSAETVAKTEAEVRRIFKKYVRFYKAE